MRPVATVDATTASTGTDWYSRLQCNIEQTDYRREPKLLYMHVQNIKLAASAAWLLVALIVAVSLDLPMTGQWILAALAVLPPLAVLLLWNGPAQTMSESIQDAKR
jgi:hypothetical protein